MTARVQDWLVPAMTIQDLWRATGNSLKAALKNSRRPEAGGVLNFAKLSKANYLFSERATSIADFNPCGLAPGTIIPLTTKVGVELTPIERASSVSF